MIYAIAAVLVLIADQWLKYWVTVNVALDSEAITLIPGVLDLVNIHNTGAAFGILQGGGWRWVFVVIALIFVAIAVYAIKRGLIRGAVGRWAVVGILAGAIGNCIDRVINGYVVDMFKPVFLEGTVFGAIFNIADMFISCCGILFCIYILFGREYKSGAGEDYAEEEPKRRREKSRGGKARGGHVKGAPRRSTAREAREESIRRYEPERQQPAARPAERTRIPVQQPRPQRPQQARPVDPKNPFAEWETPAQPAARPAAQPQGGAARSAPSAAYGQGPAGSGAAPAVGQASRPEPETRRPEPEPAPAQPKRGEYEFTLEEILAEFSDK